MSVGLPGKKYGLKLNPNAVAAAAVARKHDALVGRKRPASQMSSGLAIKNVFACSDDDEDQGDDGPKTQEEVNRMLATGGSYADLRRRRQKRDIEQVLLQDETAFEFDSVYHELQAERATQAAAHQQQKRERKARYVQDLLKHAEAREREHAIILERRLLRERAAEDHLFGDKERFVTSAYKQKLLEEELWKREQQEKDARDEANSAERLGQRGQDASRFPHAPLPPLVAPTLYLPCLDFFPLSLLRRHWVLPSESHDGWGRQSFFPGRW